jgi:acyl carrier protein
MSSELEILAEYIRTELGYEGELDQDSDLLGEKILDSFSIVQLAMYVQDAFDVELEPEDLVRDNLSTIANILALIESRKS